MELDEFKQLYKERLKTETMRHSADELAMLIHSKTYSVTEKIKRSIWFELSVYLFFTVAALFVWIVFPSRLSNPFAMLTIALCCIYFLYLVALYKKIRFYEKSGFAIKDSLRQLITIVQQFTRLYFQFTMVTLPILFVFGLIALYLNVTNNPSIKSFNWLRGILFYTGWFLLWWTAMYFFARWYIKKLYGNYLYQLKLHLKDIENG